MPMHGNQDSATATPRDLAGGDGISRDQQARKNTSTLLRRARAVGHVNIAAYAGVTDTLVSRWFSENADAMGKALALMGLKCVSVDKRCFDPDEIDALVTMARKRMDRVRSADDLDFEDDAE